MSRPLADRVLTYDALGATLARTEAPGFRIEEGSVRVGSGPERWEYVAAEVLAWGVKTRSGFTVDGGAAVVGRRYWLTAGLGPLRIREPVEVVAIINEPDRQGFAYGTLSGHPVSGEEAFVAERRADDSVWLSVRSMTRPSRGPWSALHPLLLQAQRRYKERYLRAFAA
jgi:uncharacterized protein (UPF0548 family)